MRYARGSFPRRFAPRAASCHPGPRGLGPPLSACNAQCASRVQKLSVLLCDLP
jgi:hypothetical protein